MSWNRREVLGVPLSLGVGRIAAANPGAQVGAGPGTSASAALGSLAGARSGQRYLFQSVRRSHEPSRLPGGDDLLMDRFGPNADYVDFFCGWPWDRPGGDWLDAKSVRHGPRPWFSVPTPARPAAPVDTHMVDVSGALRWVQQQARWCAVLLRSPQAFRKIAGLRHPQGASPSIRVRYEDGSDARLACRLVAEARSGQPATALASVALPAFLEFERPDRPVKEATLWLSITEHGGDRATPLEGFLLDPPSAPSPLQQGVAASGAPLDADLIRNPSVIGVHRYVDGSRLEDFLLPERVNTLAEREFDPALWNAGPSDPGKLPHRGLGRWVNINTDPAQWSMVGSNYRAEGFEPLAAGVGAMRFTMPVPPGLQDGAVVGYGGTGAANAAIFLPEPLFGRLDRIFVRYYLRLAEPLSHAASADVRRRYQVYNGPERRLPQWTDRGGKFGITPEHTTSYGGVSGSSGMGFGWQMRLAWEECDAATAGPDEGGWRPGFHLYDFLERQPPAHRYASSERHQMYWGQRSGWGGMLYLNRWYCIETELHLNTVHSQAPGYKADGSLRAWVNGRLAFERTGMVFRALPLHDPGRDPARIRPCRELGVRALWMNWFHGGKTANSVDRTMFVTGLAWGRDYLGPMRLPGT
ncbi:hypothetical protein BurJ1DRAFT_3178 [Burkholderiales bacterium JOSHI_001]|nr:hypothetical protein BurJ1DRAFT_3178 [Burkholderiales bacterium JOSHI_001]